MLVIDLQTSFCSTAGSMARQGSDVAPLAAVLPVCRALVDAARAAGVTVIWTRIGWAADYADGGRLVHELRPNLARIGALKRGTGDWRIVPQLAPRSSEPIFDKTRFSALVGTTLEADLRARGIDTIIVCGVTTSMCVESTVRDLGQRDFAVVVAHDACADFTAERHAGALATMQFGFARLADTAAVVHRWNAAAARAGRVE